MSYDKEFEYEHLYIIKFHVLFLIFFVKRVLMQGRLCFFLDVNYCCKKPKIVFIFRVLSTPLKYFLFENEQSQNLKV